jgi:lipid A 3-O-deacylase
MKGSRFLVTSFASVGRASQLKILGLLILAPAVLSAYGHPQSFPEIFTPSWDFSVWAAAATGEENTNRLAESQVLLAGVFVGRATGEIGKGWRRGRFEYGIDFIPLFVQFTPERISGTAFDPIILRWKSTQNRGRVSPFAELGGGAVHTSVNLPAGDSSTFNFIARGGGGILISTRQNQALELACRWWHISNANLGRRNPEFNGIQVSLGWHWFK